MKDPKSSTHHDDDREATMGPLLLCMGLKQIGLGVFRGFRRHVIEFTK